VEKYGKFSGYVSIYRAIISSILGKFYKKTQSEGRNSEKKCY
jgi:hypothetical protein